MLLYLALNIDILKSYSISNFWSHPDTLWERMENNKLSAETETVVLTEGQNFRCFDPLKYLCSIPVGSLFLSVEN